MSPTPSNGSTALRRPLAPPLAAAAALFGAVVFAGCAPSERGAALDLAWIEYPQAERTDVVDTYYDVEVPDPYRWLEDEPSEQTQVWLTKQDAITERFFAELDSYQRFRSYLEDNWLSGALSVPVRRGERRERTATDGQLAGNHKGTLADRALGADGCQYPDPG